MKPKRESGEHPGDYWRGKLCALLLGATTAERTTNTRRNLAGRTGHEQDNASYNTL